MLNDDENFDGQDASWRVQEGATHGDLGERTTKFAREVIHLFVSLPKEPVARVLGRQMLRSGTSVGANFRESRRARSKAEFIAKMGDCLKELDETACWLELLGGEGFLRNHRSSSLHDGVNRLISIFVASRKRARSAD